MERIEGEVEIGKEGGFVYFEKGFEFDRGGNKELMIWGVGVMRLNFWYYCILFFIVRKRRSRKIS